MAVIKEESEEKKENVQENKGFMGSIKSLVSFGGKAKAKEQALANSSGSDGEDDQMNRSMEDVDSDELDGDMNLSDNEEEA